jgi:hypothetical protein
VTREGYEDASLPVVLRAGTERDLTVSLERTTPVTHRWWFWTTASAVIAGGIALSVALVTERSPERGSLNPGVVRAPLQFGF